MKKPLRIILVFCLILFTANPSFSEEASINAAKREAITQSEIFLKEAKKIRPKLQEKPLIIAKEQETPALAATGPLFFIKQIVLDGNTLFSNEELAQYTRDHENKEISFSDLKLVASLITFHYRSRGYTTSRAFVPPQKVEGQTAHISILEGKISKILVEGNRYYSEALYKERIHLRSDGIFKYQDLESSLYNLNKKPDIKAKAYLMPGSEPSSSDIILKTDELYPIHAYYDYNNHGTKLTHYSRHSVELDHNNLTGHMDSLRAIFSYAEEGALNGIFGSYNFPVERTGTVYYLDSGFVRSSIVGIRTNEVKGKSFSLSPAIVQTFIQTNRFTLDGYFGFEVKDSKTLIDDERISFDRMRVLKIGPKMTFLDALGKTLFSANIHRGLGSFLGGSKQNDPSASVENSGGDFTYYTASLARLQRLPWSSYLVMRTNGQWTRDTLTSTEQFRAGGAYTVRGYPESDSSGDYGYAFSAELNAPVPFIPKDILVPYAKKSWIDSARLVAFLDGSKTYLRERPLTTTDKDRFLIGAGFGFRFDLDERVYVQIDLGYPIGDEPSDSSNKKIHMAIHAGW